MTKEEFKSALTNRYNDTKDLYEDSGSEEYTWAWKFLSSDVMNYTTYDSDVDAVLVKWTLEVVEAILLRKTFEYIKEEPRYTRYLIVCNLPFLKGKLEWGGSIRGAWFDKGGYGGIVGALNGPPKKTPTYSMSCGEIEFEQNQICLFMEALVEWAKENCRYE